MNKKNQISKENLKDFYSNRSKEISNQNQKYEGIEIVGNLE